jgi:hypothetical protein
MTKCDHDGCPREADDDCTFGTWEKRHQMMLCDYHSRGLFWRWPVVFKSRLKPIVLPKDWDGKIEVIEPTEGERRNYFGTAR